MLGRAEGCCRGRGGSMHIFSRAQRFYGGNAIVGGGLPLAAGISLADKALRPGAVTACFFGEGAAGEGVFHETLNLAALWALPVLFVCENNLYAMGVPLADSEAETDIWRKAQAYRMPAEQVDGMDPVQMEAAARRAVARIRAGEGPQFIEARTYRFRAHSMFDTQAYRTRGEIEGWRHIDPIERLRAWMVANHELSDAEAQAIESEIESEIADAVAFAEAGTLEPLEDLERFVLMDRAVQDDADDRVGPGAAGTAPPPAMAGAPVLRAGAEAAR
jgi:TPP-dependent pyruvate/acetoin dehydrogenase alpha subunit